MNLNNPTLSLKISTLELLKSSKRNESKIKEIQYKIENLQKETDKIKEGARVIRKEQLLQSVKKNKKLTSDESIVEITIHGAKGLIPVRKGKEISIYYFLKFPREIIKGKRAPSGKKNPTWGDSHILGLKKGEKGRIEIWDFDILEGDSLIGFSEITWDLVFEGVKEKLSLKLTKEQEEQHILTSSELSISIEGLENCQKSSFLSGKPKEKPSQFFQTPNFSPEDPRKEALWKIFQKYDSDGSGEIDLSEFRQFLCSVDVDLSEEECSSILEKYSEERELDFHLFYNVLTKEDLLNSVSDEALAVESLWILPRHQREEFKEILENAKVIPPEKLTPEQQLRRESLLKGDFYLPPRRPKLVRVFTSSTFTDTKEERNLLMRDVFPYLQRLCNKFGHEWQIVDMRWGVRDESTEDHKTTELCMNEILKCQMFSVATRFVTMYGNKYGYRPFPREIHAETFEKMLKEIQNRGVELDTLHRCYKIDKNSIPATYCLQRVSSILPETKSPDPDVAKKARSEWWKLFETMQQQLRIGAEVLKDPKEKHVFWRSVTEEEIENGFLKPSEKPYSFYFWRELQGVDIKDSVAHNFKDAKWLDNGEKVLDQEAQTLLEALKTRMVQDGSNDNPQRIYKYLVDYAPGFGVNLNNKKHQEYLKKFCDDMCRTLANSVISGIQAEAMPQDSLTEEIYHHNSFCFKKFESFIGRTELLSTCEQYLNKGSSRIPFVFYGESGSGKTSVMAASANMAKKDYPKNVVLITFLGTSGETCNIARVLKHICSMLHEIYYKDPSPEFLVPEPSMESPLVKTKWRLRWGSTRLDDDNPPEIPSPIPEIPEDFSKLQSHLEGLLEYASQFHTYYGGRLVIFLDSLDQLFTVNNSKQLGWLPKKLPSRVKLVVSVIPSDPSFKVLEETLEKDFLCQVPPLSPMDETPLMLTKYLEKKGRTLTSEQLQVLTQEKLSKCPLPLYVKLMSDICSNITSFTPISEITELPTTVREMINILFSRAERTHGLLLVSHSLGGITISRGGLSEGEMEDILSLDDVVLNDIYQYWTPPLRRLPPLLWTRLRWDIQDYLVNKGSTGGTLTMAWYHRQFWEAAEEKYCGSNQERIYLHELMAGYFGSKWAFGKSYTQKDGKKKFADRKVNPQDLFYVNGTETIGSTIKIPLKQYNQRKLYEWPHNLLKLATLEKPDQIPKIISDLSNAICDLEYLEGKASCGELDDYIEELLQTQDLAKRVGPEKLVHVTQEFLKFTRMNSHRVVKSSRLVLQQAINSSQQFIADLASGLKPNFPWIKHLDKKIESNSSLFATIHGHEEYPNLLSWGMDNVIYSCSHQEHLVKSWNPKTLSLINQIPAGNDSIYESAITASGEFFAFLGEDGKFIVMDIKTSKVLWEVDLSSTNGDSLINAGICQFSPSEKFVAISVNGSFYIWETKTGKELAKTLGQYVIGPDGSEEFTDWIWTPDSERIILSSHLYGDRLLVIKVPQGIEQDPIRIPGLPPFQTDTYYSLLITPDGKYIFAFGVQYTLVFSKDPKEWMHSLPKTVWYEEYQDRLASLKLTDDQRIDFKLSQDQIADIAKAGFYCDPPASDLGFWGGKCKVSCFSCGSSELLSMMYTRVDDLLNAHSDGCPWRVCNFEEQELVWDYLGDEESRENQRKSDEKRKAMQGQGLGMISEAYSSEWGVVKRYRPHPCVQRFSTSKDAKFFNHPKDDRLCALIPGDASVGYIILLDVWENVPLASYPGHTYSIQSLSISPDLSQFVSCDIDKVINIWNIWDGTFTQAQGDSNALRIGYLRDIQFVNNSTIWGLDRSNFVQIDVPTGEVLLELRCTDEKLSDTAWKFTVLNNDLIAWSNVIGSIFVGRLSTKEMLLELNCKNDINDEEENLVFYGTGFTPDGKTVWGISSGRLYLISLENPNERITVDYPILTSIDEFFFIQEKQLSVVVSKDNIKVLDMRDLRNVQVIQTISLDQKSFCVTYSSWSSDKRLYVGGDPSYPDICWFYEDPSGKFIYEKVKLVVPFGVNFVTVKPGPPPYQCLLGLSDFSIVFLEFSVDCKSFSYIAQSDLPAEIELIFITEDFDIFGYIKLPTSGIKIQKCKLNF